MATSKESQQSSDAPSKGPPLRVSEFLAERHDHEHCIETALNDAEAVCAKHGARFTPLRRRVLEIVWQSHQPLGAYAILESLSVDGRQPAPPTVYRSLEFLQEHGLVHRIASLNAFIGCQHPGHATQGQFLICTQCSDVAELVDDELQAHIQRNTASLGFAADNLLVEVTGICPNCRASAST